MLQVVKYKLEDIQTIIPAQRAQRIMKMNRNPVVIPASELESIATIQGLALT